MFYHKIHNCLKMAGNGAEATRNSSGALVALWESYLFSAGFVGRIDNLIVLPEGYEINRNFVMHKRQGRKRSKTFGVTAEESAANQRLTGKYKADYDLLGWKCIYMIFVHGSWEVWNTFHLIVDLRERITWDRRHISPHNVSSIIH